MHSVNEKLFKQIFADNPPLSIEFTENTFEKIHFSGIFALPFLSNLLKRLVLFLPLMW